MMLRRAFFVPLLHGSASAKTVASQGGTFRLNWIHLWTRVNSLISEIALDILVSLD